MILSWFPPPPGLARDWMAAQEYEPGEGMDTVADMGAKIDASPPDAHFADASDTGPDASPQDNEPECQRNFECNDSNVCIRDGRDTAPMRMKCRKLCTNLVPPNFFLFFLQSTDSTANRQQDMRQIWQECDA